MIRLAWKWLFAGEPQDANAKIKELQEQIRRMEKALEAEDGAESKPEPTKRQRESEVIEPTNCFQKTGRVTCVKGDHFIIDNVHFVSKRLLNNLNASERVEENTRLRFLAYKKVDEVSGETMVKVIKILSVIDEMWTEGGGGLAAPESTWEPKLTTAAAAAVADDTFNGADKTVYYKGCHRREPGMVAAKERNLLTVETDAGDPISMDMDKTRMSFVPIRGDYVTLDCVVQLDVEYVDYKGEVLEVISIEPSRTVNGRGRICTTDACGGEISTPSGTFVYQPDCLAACYRPSVGDTVEFQAIENEHVQMRCLSVKLVSAAVAARPVGEGDSSPAKGRGDRSTARTPNARGEEDRAGKNQLWDDKRGIRVVGDFEVVLKNTTESAVRVIRVKNESNGNHKILQIEPRFLQQQQQQRLVSLQSPAAFSQIFLTPGETTEYVFNITGGSFFGRHSETWVWKFAGNFEIGRSFRVRIGEKACSEQQDGGGAEFQTTSDQAANKRRKLLQQKLAALNMIRGPRGDRIIGGQRFSKRPNFIAFSIPFYTVPPDLFELVLSAENHQLLQEALGKPPYCLNEPLSARNYARLFDHFIFLEEIHQYIAFRNYDIERGHFTREDIYLALHVPNIAEARPSVMIGDSVEASAPWSHEGDAASAPIYQGIIYKVLQNRVLLKFDANFHARYNGESYRITFSFGRGLYRKQHHAISRVKTVMGLEYLFPAVVEPRQPGMNVRLNEHDELVLLVGPEQEDKEGAMQSKVLPWQNPRLNHCQKNAVMNVLRGEARPQPYVIFGPPGTGKTVTTIELIYQLALNSPDCRLIVATPSNSAAYLITERLANGGVLKAGDFVRLVSMNQVERELIPEHLAPYCAMVDVSDDRTTTNTPLTTESGLRMKFQAKHIGRHRVTISTCTTIGLLMQLRFPRNHFTHVIIDEAGQTLEPDTLIPISLINHTIGSVTLVGDPKQLGPVVLSRNAAQADYSISMLERLLNTCRPYAVDRERFPTSQGYDPRLVTKLCISYRAIPSVLALYSDIFYDSQLTADQAANTPDDTTLLAALHEILKVERPTTDYGFFFCGVDGTNKQSPDSPSWFNPAEARMVHTIVERLYRQGYGAGDIGIVTPYVMQVKMVRRIFEAATLEPPKIGSVEEFQGQERRVVIISTVRSAQALLTVDRDALLGFVSEPKRVNVALSRAKTAVVVVGNPKLLGTDPIWVQVLQRAISHKTYVGTVLSSYFLSTIATTEQATATNEA